MRDNALLVTEEDSEPWHGVMSDITERENAEAEPKPEHRAAQQAAVARLGEHALEAPAYRI